MSEETPAPPKKRGGKQNSVKAVPAAFGDGKQLVYIGPSIHHKGLRQGTIYRRGLPAHLKALIEEVDGLKSLFVEPSNLVKAKQELLSGGARASQLGRVIAHFARKEA